MSILSRVQVGVLPLTSEQNATKNTIVSAVSACREGMVAPLTVPSSGNPAASKESILSAASALAEVLEGLVPPGDGYDAVADALPRARRVAVSAVFGPLPNGRAAAEVEALLATVQGEAIDAIAQGA